MWFKISQRYYFLLNLCLVRKCIAYLVSLLMTVTLRAQDVSVRDVELSRYEVLCEAAWISMLVSLLARRYRENMLRI